jgi:1,4-alpha-glucan branching enzyme
MGGEFGQEREWNHDQSLDWHLLSDSSHRGIHALMRDLNLLYRSTPALHELDCEGSGFDWIDASDAAQSVLSYIRYGREGTAPVVIVCNFTPVVRHNFRLGVPKSGSWMEKLNTDSDIYGGSNVGNLGGVKAEKKALHGRPYSIELTLPPLATVVLQHAGN